MIFMTFTSPRVSHLLRCADINGLSFLNFYWVPRVDGTAGLFFENDKGKETLIEINEWELIEDFEPYTRAWSLDELVHRLREFGPITISQNFIHYELIGGQMKHHLIGDNSLVDAAALLLLDLKNKL